MRERIRRHRRTGFTLDWLLRQNGIPARFCKEAMTCVQYLCGCDGPRVYSMVQGCTRWMVEYQQGRVRRVLKVHVRAHGSNGMACARKQLQEVSNTDDRLPRGSGHAGRLPCMITRCIPKPSQR